MSDESLPLGTMVHAKMIHELGDQLEQYRYRQFDE